MSILEIVGGGMLIVSCLLIILLVAMQSEKGEGLSGAIMGGSSAAATSRGRSRSNEARLGRLTKIFAVVYFVMTFAVNIIAAVMK